MREAGGVKEGVVNTYVAHGGTSVEDPPGPRQGALGTMHLAYVRDPDGNKLCALHRPK